MFDFDEIRININNGCYKCDSSYSLQRKLLKPGTIIDEDQTVRWNKEQVENRNAELKKQIEEIKQSNVKQHTIFKSHMFEAANKDYNLNNSQCELIYNKLMSELDCNYLCISFVNEFEDMCDFVYQCCNT